MPARDLVAQVSKIKCILLHKQEKTLTILFNQVIYEEFFSFVTYIFFHLTLTHREISVGNCCLLPFVRMQGWKRNCKQALFVIFSIKVSSFEPVYSDSCKCAIKSFLSLFNYSVLFYMILTSVTYFDQKETLFKNI